MSEIPSGGQMRIEFGRRWVAARRISAIRPGTVIELDCPADGCVDVRVAGRARARGRPVVMDSKLCVEVKEVQA